MSFPGFRTYTTTPRSVYIAYLAQSAVPHSSVAATLSQAFFAFAWVVSTPPSMSGQNFTALSVQRLTGTKSATNCRSMRNDHLAGSHHDAANPLQGLPLNSNDLK
jgi:hypothetical protein